MEIILESNNSINSSFKLCYQLISLPFMHETEEHTGFGISLSKLDNKDNVISQKVVNNITTIEEKAIEFLELITRNFVTPEILDEVLEDFLA